MIGGYLTLSHSHGALWGVYGVLAIALSLLVLRLSDIKAQWDTRWAWFFTHVNQVSGRSLDIKALKVANPGSLPLEGTLRYFQNSRTQDPSRVY